MPHRPAIRSRLRLILLTVGLVAIGGISAAFAQPSVRLELGGQHGDWLRYSHRNDLVVELPADLGGTASTRTTIRLLQVLEGVSVEALSYVTTLEEVSLDVRPPPEAIPDLSGIQGLSFHHTTSRAGRTLSLRVAGQTAEAGPELVEQLENWLGQLGFPPLPDRPVQVGEEWSEAVPVPAMALGLAVDYDVVQNRRVRLAELRSAGTSQVAFLAVTTIWEPSETPTGAGGGVASLRGTAEQTVRFDLVRGRFIGSTGTSELEIVLTPPGAGQYVAVSARGRQVTGLTAYGDEGSDLRE